MRPFGSSESADPHADPWHRRYSRRQLVEEIDRLREEIRRLGGEVALERHLRIGAERDLVAFVEYARTRMEGPWSPSGEGG